MNHWSGYLTLILEGALVTVEITALALILALLMSFFAGIGRGSSIALVRGVSTIYVEFFRGTSVFVQLFWAYFVLPLVGVPVTSLQAGVLALGLNVGAYGAEAVRGAIAAIGQEQRGACIALNLTRYQSLRHVILPQALPLMLPTFGNNAIELLKGTAVVSLVSLSDMTFQAQAVRAQTGNTLIPFITILLLYFGIACAISGAFRLIEKKVALGLDGLGR